MTLDGPKELERILPGGDEDWFSFQTQDSGTYTIETFRAWNLGGSLDTVIALYDSEDGETPLFVDDDGGTEELSRITLILKGNHLYLVKVHGYSESASFYRIGIRTEPKDLSLPVVPLKVNDLALSSSTISGASEHWYLFRTTISGIYAIKTLQIHGYEYVPRQILLYCAQDDKVAVASVSSESTIVRGLPHNQMYKVKIVLDQSLSSEHVNRYLIEITAIEASQLYVRLDSPPGRNGLSWENAFNSIRAALEITLGAFEIWVAAGTYTENVILKPGVALYGGFTGIEQIREQRNWVANETIIDLAGLSTTAVTGADDAILDGFIVKGGTSSGVNCDGSLTLINCTITSNTGVGVSCSNSSPTLTNCTIVGNTGGGVYCSYSSLALTNCTITGNTTELYGGGVCCMGRSFMTMTNCTIMGNTASIGGGVYCYSSSPRLTNCTITGNSADYSGGGVYCEYGTPTLTNCTITGNTADSGSGLTSKLSSPTLTNCTVAGNTAQEGGGGVYCWNSSPTLINCTFSGNDAPNGNAIYGYSPPNRSSTVNMVNCIVWDGGNEFRDEGDLTITISYSDIQGGWPGEGNIDIDPQFIQPCDGESADLHLLPTSPCIDAGDPDSACNDAFLPPGLGTERCDMGAYGGPGNSGWGKQQEPVAVLEWIVY